MPEELFAQKTPIPTEEVLKGLYDAWYHVFGNYPKKESVLVLASQWALETGWGKSMWNYNLGNVKSTEKDGRNYCYFACNEILKTSVAEGYVKKNPDTAKITKYRDNGTAIIWFYPKHSGCRFRAFHNLLEGCIDYIGVLNQKFNRSWPAVLAGDPKQFAHLLKLQGYYTADESEYTNTINGVFGMISKLKVDFTKHHDDKLTEDEKNRIINLVTLTAIQGLENI